MEMTLRWFGKKYDSVSLKDIRQIPGVSGVISTLYNKMPGEIWCENEVKELKNEIESNGLKLSGIESINIHDSIKAGTKERDKYIENYIKSLEAVGKEDIKLVCYNFMPIFDWTRSDLTKVNEEGAKVLSYDENIISKINVETIFDLINKDSNGFMLPGWEPERIENIKELFKVYSDVNEEKLFDNLVYFLKAIMPTCEKYGIKMAIHPDDPAWSVFGLPRIINNKENILRMLQAVPSKSNGITLCTGSLASNENNNLIEIIHETADRINFAHVRNIKRYGNRSFDECAHLSSEGSLDMYEIMKALYEVGFDGVIRPDHGRNIWGEVSMPGYGLYDRALGATYLNGIWEAIDKERR